MLIDDDALMLLTDVDTLMLLTDDDALMLLTDDDPLMLLPDDDTLINYQLAIFDYILSIYVFLSIVHLLFTDYEAKSIDFWSCYQNKRHKG